MAISDAQELFDQTSFASAKFMPRSTVKSFESPHNKSRQKNVNPFAEWWEVDVRLVPGTQSSHRQWTGYLTGLNGSEHTVLFGDASAQVPFGSAAGSPGTPQVSGSPSLGSKTIDIKLASLSQVTYLQMGDWIQLGAGSTARLYKVTKNMSTDGSGNGTLDIFPGLLVLPSVSDPVVVSGTRGLFELKENSFPDWTTGAGGVIQTISFTLKGVK